MNTSLHVVRRREMLGDSRAKTTPMYIDCDTGIDDALAIALILADSSTSVVGIGSVSGNVDAHRAAQNTLDLLSLLGMPEIQVAVGATAPIGAAFKGGAPEVHGELGLGGVDLASSTRTPKPTSAAEMLVDLARVHEGELELLAIGPLTNLALALDLEPNIAGMIKRVTVMGGALRVAGNVSPYAEANFANDPEAADRVLSARWPITLVPLDLTMQHRFDEAAQALLAGGSHSAHSKLATMLSAYFDFYAKVLGKREAPLHDPLAAAVANRKLPVEKYKSMKLRVDASNGQHRGRVMRSYASSRRKVDVIEVAGRDSADLILREILELGTASK